jgi:elongation factor P
MKVNANQISRGNVVEHNGRIWIAVKVAHINPGKGGAFVQMELRDVRDGTKLNERFRSGESVEKSRLDEQELQFLFHEGDDYTFMDVESYEQMTIQRELIGDSAAFLQDGMRVTVQSHEGSPVSVELPQTVIMTVVEADPVVKGQTASSSFKPGKLENGERIMVPPHIAAGTRVVVNTSDGSYVERAKD